MASTNITTFPGKVGISNANPTHTLAIGSNVYVDDIGINKLVVLGSISTTGTLSGDGSVISNIQSSNVIGLTSNVERIDNLVLNLSDNSSRITTVANDLSDNSSRITILESGDTNIRGKKTFTEQVTFESNIHVKGDLLVANTINMVVSDPIIELGSNNLNTGDLGIVMTRHGTSSSNVAVFYDESADVLKMGYTLSGANDTTIELDSNALAVSIQGNLEVGTADLFVDTTTGNVGIGTASPVGVNGGQRLEGSSSTGFEYIATRDDTTGTLGDFVGAYLFKNPDTDGNPPHYAGMSAKISGTNGPMDLRFYTNRDKYETDVPNMIIESGGNVGIGTTNPGATLDVAGTIMIKVDRASSSARNWAIRTNNTNEGDFQIGHTGSNTGGLPDFYATPSYAKLTINNAGNVGIGTDDPATALHVRNPGGADIASSIIIQPASTTYTRGYAKIEAYPDATSGAGTGLKFYTRQDSGSDFDPASLVTERMTIKNNGNVGIGTTNPTQGKLHINGSVNYTLGAQYYNVGGGNSYTTTSRPLSMYASAHIACSELQVFSDRRIKDNIVDVQDGSALETLRLLKPKIYTYRDDIEKGEEPVWGFIAQEVRETLPYATQLIKNTIPNIYELANVSQSNVITFTNFNTANLESNATTLMRTKGTDGEDRDIHLVEVIDEHTIRVEDDLSGWIGSVDESGNVISGNQLFVYGQEVNDFVSLQKSAIWTVATAALQEVDRQLQAEKVKTVTLETQLADLLARVQALEAV